MKFTKATVGYGIAALLVIKLWGEFGNVGLWGGFLAAAVIIAPMWYMNHYLNLTGQENENAFVDIGLAIAIAGLVRDTLNGGLTSLVAASPTLIMVILGAIAGGSVAAFFEKQISHEENRLSPSPEPGFTESELIRVNLLKGEGK